MSYIKTTKELIKKYDWRKYHSDMSNRNSNSNVNMNSKTNKNIKQIKHLKNMKERSITITIQI